MNRFLSQIYLSCSDFSFYKSIVRQKLYSTFQYFFVLLLGVTVLSSGISFFHLKEGMRLLAEWSHKHLPEISIRDGIVTSPVSQPYTAFEDNFVFILDTTGEIDRIQPQYANGVLVTKDRLWIKRPGVETQNVDLSWVKELDLNAQVVESWKGKLIPVILPFLFVLTLIGMGLSKLLQAFLFSFSASVFFPEEKSGLNFQNLFNLSIYALTPATITAIVVQVFQLNVPAFWWIYFGMYAAFFIGAYMHCKTTTETKQDGDFGI